MPQHRDGLERLDARPRPDHGVRVAELEVGARGPALQHEVTEVHGLHEVTAHDLGERDGSVRDRGAGRRHDAGRTPGAPWTPALTSRPAVRRSMRKPTFQ